MPKPAGPGGRLSRVRVGFMVASVVFGLAFLGGWFWSALVALSVWLGFKELRHIMAVVGIKPSQIIVYAAAFLMLMVASLDKPNFLNPILTLAAVASFFRLIFRSPRATTADIGGTLISVLYTVYFPVHYILLRNLGVTPDLAFYEHPGLRYLVMTLAVISASDIAAYYVGKKLGKTPMSPEISPKKTREGAIGGVVGGVAIGLLFAWMFDFPMNHAAILSTLLVVVGQLGDLAESLMKRDSGLKDSGGMLASHGGFLDRADSYIFSGAVAYYYIYWVVLRQGLALELIQWFRHLGVS